MADWNSERDFYLILTDTTGPGAYPITATTFALVPKHQPDRIHTRALLRLFEWALFQGQDQATALGYVPSPQRLALRVETYWNADVDH